jgi:putative ABC transport system substrate-binding protein
MHRRHFIPAALAVLALPSLSRAQPARKPARIGVLSSTSPDARTSFWSAFKDGMAKLGWAEGRDVNYIYRYTGGDSSRFDALAAELVAEKPDLIFTGTQSAALAAKRATREIPIVFAMAVEPITSGLVASLAKPGGNATGLTSIGVETRTKTLELLRDIRPQTRHVAVVIAPGEVGQQTLMHIEHAARARGIEVHPLVVADPDDLEKALQTLADTRVDGVLFLGTGMTSRQKVTRRMTELKLPAIYEVSEMVVAGGLASYGAELVDNYRRAAKYADRILNGAKPADLPVEQPTKFELLVNLKAAREQGIKIPQSVLVRATRVIE